MRWRSGLKRSTGGKQSEPEDSGPSRPGEWPLVPQEKFSSEQPFGESLIVERLNPLKDRQTTNDQRPTTKRQMTNKSIPRVVIVGSGFAGLTAARRIARLPVHVTVVDRKNHHTFQPLLYQVATAGLSPGEIAAPIRWILRSHSNVQVLLEEVLDFDLEQKKVITKEQVLNYDFLIVASGATHAYFGHEEWEPLAPGLKTIEDALEIRRRVLLAFELAERRNEHPNEHPNQTADGESAPPLQFPAIGDGPTGVELAGTLAEIARHALNHEFRNIDPRQSRILLIEGGPRVLPAYSEELSRKAEAQLRRLGVEVRTSHMVTRIEPGAVWVGDERIQPQSSYGPRV